MKRLFVKILYSIFSCFQRLNTRWQQSLINSVLMCWKSTLILFCHPHFDFPVSLFSSDFGTNVFWIVLLLLECCVSHVSHHPQFHHSFKLSWTIRIWISSSCYFLHVIFESLKDKYVHVHVFIIFWKKKKHTFFWLHLDYTLIIRLSESPFKR